MVKIAVASDFHLDLSGRASVANREVGLIDLLAERFVHTINRHVAPDITLILGDLVDEGDGRDAHRHYLRLREHFDRIESPLIIIPGNHDGPAFLNVFGKPAGITDCSGVRFVACVDPEEPGYNARRMPAELSLMQEARRGYDGPIVMLQHVPVFPPGSHDCPYSYVNATEIVEAVEELGINLSLSGHYHHGIDGLERNGTVFHTVEAFCENPFSFDVIEIDTSGVEILHHQLVPDAQLGLFDSHVHTQFSYCGPTMKMERSVDLAPRLGLSGFAFTEHSGQMYYEESTYWSDSWYRNGIEPQQDRSGMYLRAAKAYPEVPTGFECDIYHNGNLVLQPQVTPDLALGAVHKMAHAGWNRTGDLTPAIADEFLFLNEKLMANGVDIIAHPFRVLSRVSAVEALFEPMVDLLAEYGVAAELNFHINYPHEDFFRRCIQRGVPIAFGSDAHEHWEFGNFVPHLAFLEGLGFDGQLSDVLYRP